MKQIDHQINLDRAVDAGDNASKEAMQPASETKKTPWHLRFAPGAILRKKAIIAILAIGAALTPIQTEAAGSGVGAVVEFFLSWAAGETLNTAKNSILATNGGTNKTPLARLSPTAKAVANTAYWLSNSFEQITKEDEWDFANQRWTGNWTTTTESASQLREDNNESLSGRWANGKAMTQAQAKRSLLRAKVSYKWHKFEVFYSSDSVYVDDYWVYARADAIEKQKAKHIKHLTEILGEAVYAGHAFEQQTTTYNVGSYEMESKFENITGHSALSQKSKNADANDYEGTVYWTYNNTNEDGTSVYPGEETSSDYEFKSYKPDSSWVEDLCKEHQSLSVAPEINNTARREFQNQAYKKWVFVSGGVSGNLGGGHGWAGWIDTKRIKRVLVQIEN